MGTVPAANMLSESTDSPYLNRMEECTRNSGFSGFVVRVLHKVPPLKRIGFRDLDQRPERQWFIQPIVCLSLHVR